jgi:hypothetical protein
MGRGGGGGGRSNPGRGGGGGGAGGVAHGGPSAATVATLADPARFAEAALALAAAVPMADRDFGAKKVMVSDAYDAFAGAHPGVTLEQFQRAVIRAVGARHLDVTRVDLIEGLYGPGGDATYAPAVVARNRERVRRSALPGWRVGGDGDAYMIRLGY